MPGNGTESPQARDNNGALGNHPTGSPRIHRGVSMSPERVMILKKAGTVKVSGTPGFDAIGPLHQISSEDSSIHRRCVIDRAQREHHKRMIGPEDAPKGPPELESLDFDSINSPYWVDSARRPPRTLIGYSGDTFVRWVIAILIGFFVACLAKVPSLLAVPRGRVVS